jgi:copper chaperone CopZ
MFKKIVIAALLFIAIGNKSFAQTEQPATSTTDTTITVKVKGVTCKNDLNTLSTNVKDVKGVSECKSGKAGPVSEFKITYNPTLVNTKEIFKAIENTPGCADPNDRPYKVKTN